LKGTACLSISISPDGKFLASAYNFNTIRVWSLTDGNCIESIETSSIFKVQFSPDSRMLLANEGSRIRLRSMDKYMLHELQEERADLMKLNIQELQEELTNHDIYFHSTEPITKALPVDLLVDHVDQNQRKEILMRKNIDS
jgi:WD40 repeat protein